MKIASTQPSSIAAVEARAAAAEAEAAAAKIAAAAAEVRAAHAESKIRAFIIITTITVIGVFGSRIFSPSSQLGLTVHLLTQFPTSLINTEIISVSIAPIIKRLLPVVWQGASRVIAVKAGIKIIAFFHMPIKETVIGVIAKAAIPFTGKSGAIGEVIETAVIGLLIMATAALQETVNETLNPRRETRAEASPKKRDIGLLGLGFLAGVLAEVSIPDVVRAVGKVGLTIGIMAVILRMGIVGRRRFNII